MPTSPGASGRRLGVGLSVLRQSRETQSASNFLRARQLRGQVAQRLGALLFQAQNCPYQSEEPGWSGRRTQARLDGKTS